MTGTYWAFLAAVLIILIWAMTGPLFGFSDTRQLVINTGTTVVTFLMVFLIQNTQNRDTLALHLKLDELIRAIDAASNELIDIEEGSEHELQQLQAEYRQRAGQAHRNDAGGDIVRPTDAVYPAPRFMSPRMAGSRCGYWSARWH